MKQRFTFSLLMSAVLLASCGGGAGSSGTPSTPKPQSKVAIQFTSPGRTTQTLRAQATCPTSLVSAPAVIQATADWNPAVGDNWGAIDGSLAQATEYDANCAIVSTAATFTVSDPTLVTTTVPAWAQPALATPSPGTEYLFGNTPGQVTLTATFPDQSTGTAPVHIYGLMGVGCHTNYYLGANGNLTPGWSDATGQIQAVDACGTTGYGNAPFDMQMDSSSYNVLIPGGYDILQGPSTFNDLAAITSCSAFTSQGTTLSVNPTQIPRLQSNFLMIFKTQDGKCVKVFVQQVFSDGIVGLFAVSDSSGNFAF